jgi:hypothetical protein
MMGELCLGFEELEGFVVCDHMDPVSHEFVFPALERLEYCKCFHFVYCVVLLCQGELLGHESSRSTSLPRGPLSVHCPNAGLRRIAYQPNGLIQFGVYWAYDWCLLTYVLDHIKALLVDEVPMKWCTILCHGHQWAGVGCHVGQEIGHVVDQSYEPLDIVVIMGGSPVYDAGQLVHIGVDPLVINDVA